MLRWLFVDMNSYFASVEQQLRPELRGKPVAVVAVDTDSTSCIAASYEAKAFGIRTGTNLGFARHVCPQLQVVQARSHEYVDMHHKIVRVVENHLHVHKIFSIDEMACRLPSNENSEERAVAIARAIKDSLRRELGECIRCSVGVAPNRFLAKVASDMQKPDGLIVLQKADLPAKLLHLGIRDLPGVGPNMQVRLSAHGADTMEALWNFSPDQLARAFGGITGTHFWGNLHGEPAPEIDTGRHSVSHSSVLAPEWRTDEKAFAVLIRLVHKAAARLRDMDYAAGTMSMHIAYASAPAWGMQIGIDYVRDTQTLIEAMEFLWNHRRKGLAPKKVGIALSNLEWTKNLTLPLFGHDVRRNDLATAMDAVNSRFGRQMLYFAEMHETRHAARMRIAFNSVPDDDW